MDQQKIGCFLRELRNEKGLTQEQLAEKFNISNRSISRWENGKNMPDISLLVDIADFYDVDVREIIDGERKSGMMEDEIKEVAVKMADYADEGQSRLFHWVRCISLLGVIFMVIILALQTFSYEPGIVSFICYIFSILAFIVMVILTLYANGILAKITKNKKLIVACKILVIGIAAAVALFAVRVLLLVVLVAFAESSPFKNIAGIENYDKSYYLDTYGGDLDTGLFIFPDNTEDMINPSFVSSLKTGLFDTDGYLILHTQYSQEKYLAEINRLSKIQCVLTFNGEEVTQKVKYDEKTYALPAYVAVDGFDYVYEYALVDERDFSISYILLSYPEYRKMSQYTEYLKLDTSEYNIENVLEKFSIYAHSFDGGDSWMEYED